MYNTDKYPVKFWITKKKPPAKAVVEKIALAGFIKRSAIRFKSAHLNITLFLVYVQYLLLGKVIMSKKLYL